MPPPPDATATDLESRLQTVHEPTDRGRLLLELATELLDSDVSRAARHAEEAISLARARGDRVAEGAALHKSGQCLLRQGEYPRLLEVQASAIDLFTELGDRRAVAQSKNLLASGLTSLSDFRTALEHYESALADYIALDDAGGQAMVLSNLGHVYEHLGDHATALELKQRGLVLREQVGPLRNIAMELNNVAHAHVNVAAAHAEHGERELCDRSCAEALQLLDRAEGVARQSGSRRTGFFCLGTRVEVLLVQHRFEDALALLRHELPDALDFGDVTIVALIYAAEGECLFRLGRHEEALAPLKEAIARLEQMGMRSEQARVLRIESDAQEALGRVDAALRSLRTATAIARSIRAEEIERQTRAIAAQRRIEQSRLEAERYRKLALEDGLTGLMNRRSVDAAIGAIMQDARRGNWWIALCDIDHFKSINDRFSHAVGDQVLVRVGAILRAHCRADDIAGRYGGEEFVFALRAGGAADAVAVCERLRAAVESEDWSSIHAELRVTLSLGLAGAAAHTDAASLFAAADARLYEAKRGGRNRVVGE